MHKTQLHVLISVALLGITISMDQLFISGSKEL